MTQITPTARQPRLRQWIAGHQPRRVLVDMDTTTLRDVGLLPRQARDAARRRSRNVEMLFPRAHA